MPDSPSLPPVQVEALVGGLVEQMDDGDRQDQLRQARGRAG